MIYLITGTPGTGKTAMILSWIRTNKDGLFKFPVCIGIDDKGNEIFEEIARPIFVNHIDGIDHDFFGTQDISDDAITADSIQNIVPTPTVLDPHILPPVLIIDESHRLYPVRSAASKTPDYVESLAELRHHGVTLILITQHPSTIDKFVRDRVGKHVHIMRAKVGSKAYTFYEVQNTLSKQALNDAMMEFYTVDSKVFQHYKSASTHVKFKKKTPKILYIFPAILILMVLSFVAVWFTFGDLTNFANVDTENQLIASDAVSASHPVAINSSFNTPQNSVSKNDTKTKSLSPADFVPSILEKPESKPIYDSVRQIKTFEQVRAVVISKGKCTAYSQQGTIVDVPDNFCRKWANEGLPFDPYKDIQQVQNQQPTQTTPES